MRGVFVLLIVGILVLPEVLQAQPTSGSQDSVLGGPLRPRRDTYIIVPFPSPARHGQVMTIQYYNHNPEQTSLRVVDELDREVVVLQQQQLMTNGLHSFDFNTALFATGAYFIRLTRYTADGSKLEVLDSRFLVVH
ncbi:MAG TPA: hypothetical protein VEW28_00340 [Candidatus Kapabacteria bacterium]|nr:hypothetical protein [Candidatus Kapabacteria bacterium]